MIPLADENPARTTPYVMYALLALNVLIYLVDIIGPKTPFVGGFLWDYTMIPWSVVTNQPAVFHMKIPVMLESGMRAVVPVNVVHTGLEPQWLTIFTSMFMHGGFMHIAMNMLYLWVFGNKIEETLGHFKFVVFYLLCGVIAAFAHIASNISSTVPTLGASGAIAGLLGAYILLFPHARIRTLIMLGFFWTHVAIPAVYVLGVWFLLQLIGVGGTGGEVGGGVAYWAHIGGFVAGAAITWLLGGKKLSRGRWQRVPPQRPYHGPNDRPYPFRPWK